MIAFDNFSIKIFMKAYKGYLEFNLKLAWYLVNGWCRGFDWLTWMWNVCVCVEESVLTYVHVLHVLWIESSYVCVFGLCVCLTWLAWCKSELIEVIFNWVQFDKCVFVHACVHTQMHACGCAVILACVAISSSPHVYVYSLGK